jgi:hypothetical protein
MSRVENVHIGCMCSYNNCPPGQRCLGGQCEREAGKANILYDASVRKEWGGMNENAPSAMISL